MASSSSSSVPAYPSPSWKYHVFLSFRGEDTRNSFVGHLYSALEQKGIYTYKDDKKLPQGELIGPSLMKAIGESYISIIIFSENYADSSWCLEELAYIMNCRETRGQIVIPLFYDVEPSELRKQKQKYGEAFLKHELENKTKVESWRKALVDASNLSGWDIANRHESEFIKEIVSKISKMLHPLTSRVNDNLVGIEARVQDLKSRLKIGSSGVLKIGIWGVGGAGKTTLASYFYDEMSREFNGCCFVENIREESSKYGLKKLQEEILSSILKHNEVLGGVKEGSQMIKDRLSHRKVIIVLDDVDQLDQLEALAGSHYWFGEGSLIVITTRDEHLLTAFKVDVIHKIRLLNDHEAIQLLCIHAPRDKIPMEDYGLLSKEVVRYVDGLPLALMVIGRFLCDKNLNEWRSALVRLKEIPHDKILEKLKISYDGLTRVEQKLFLDIACFFRWEKKDRAMEMLDACGFHAVIGVKVLMQKALLSISNGMFDMHDLVQEMGHHIVRGEHPDNPEKHSRIWKEEDVVNICAMDATMELDMIEAIRFKHNSVDHIQRYKHLQPFVANTKNLRWIEWQGDLASPLLTNFPQRKLCCLILHNSSRTQLWEGYKVLPNLKIMELWYLSFLMITPNFNGLPHLERFKLTGCRLLEEIHPSIGCLERLVFLSIEDCRRLKMFPPITQLKKLKTLSFSGCYKLFKLSEIQQNMDNLHLYNSGDTKLGLQFFCNLQELVLRKLDLSWCCLEDDDMSYALWELPNLQELNLEGNKFSQLSFTCLQLPRLKRLDVSWCRKLVELSALPSSIAIVKADHCRSLRSFGDVSNCKWLWNFSHRWESKLGEAGIILNSMLKGNAVEDHFISVAFEHQIPKGFVGRFFTGYSFTRCRPRDANDNEHTFTLRLPDDWYNDFSGFLIRIVTNNKLPDINIIFTHEVYEKDLRFEIWQDSNESPGPEYLKGEVKTYVGYVSFSSLRQTTSLNSSYNIISFSIEDMDWSSFAAELVPRERKDDADKSRKVATDSEYLNDELDMRKAFMIQHDLYSFIQILWQP
ncbi:disease resistance protein RUN1 [Lactuca sativa]|uniref:TIR domain-containing protein n=2 Tax=Lactuca TaxID=4235 RepID=A0A9R1UPZ1_LACSA|nr:disease resistance protein RUN1 [Lactuca sativa]XP_042752828.1 disease resistance protein RUN1 [Lactuca sativa]XP_042752829.1 disease resistance protein RUN1 [Lactuca sativa]XP_042752830.1 disease resistance protein RUN1 [Lactuca sativa]KAJ0191308.1 hypothetical protein LSAT_V11C800408760 [Lactuca sativa]